LGWIPVDSGSKVEDMDALLQEQEVHKYLHSRLMAFDYETLYEMHYAMISIGKVGVTVCV
jgi:hypothetical protein